MSSTLFISDLHLDADRPELTRALARFLTQHAHCHGLYILGDLFEAWIGDDDDAELALEVQSLLRGFSSKGTPLYFMRGNRDFLVGDTFANNTGAILLGDPTIIDLYGTPTLLMHGDTLCTDDRDYQVFRARVRSPGWQRQVLEQALQQRRELAQQLRQDSGAATTGKPVAIMDANPTAIAETMREYGVQQLIHGHTHRPGSHEEVFGRRWVLGDWDQSGWFLKAQPGKIELENYII